STGGRVPEGFEAVISGRPNADLAETIWLSKPAGSQTCGNTTQSITDSQGNPQASSISRPERLYGWGTVELTRCSEETFPSNGLELVAQAILAYGQSLGIGVDVLLQRVNAQIFEVSGIASGDMQLGFSTSEGGTHPFSASDISVDDIQISAWDISRINVTLAP